ncbi:hypothetical protein EIP86_007269 [Pleurotus ostreatoroseus]|nr:hypothetical protein EIP86_007269 [Pleurotus ostreatoroseus]
MKPLPTIPRGDNQDTRTLSQQSRSLVESLNSTYKLNELGPQHRSRDSSLVRCRRTSTDSNPPLAKRRKLFATQSTPLSSFLPPPTPSLAPIPSTISSCATRTSRSPAVSAQNITDGQNEKDTSPKKELPPLPRFLRKPQSATGVTPLSMPGPSRMSDHVSPMRTLDPPRQSDQSKPLIKSPSATSTPVHKQTSAVSQGQPSSAAPYLQLSSLSQMLPPRTYILTPLPSPVAVPHLSVRIKPEPTAEALSLPNPAHQTPMHDIPQHASVKSELVAASLPPSPSRPPHPPKYATSGTERVQPIPDNCRFGVRHWYENSQQWMHTVVRTIQQKGLKVTRVQPSISLALSAVPPLETTTSPRTLTPSANILAIPNANPPKATKIAVQQRTAQEALKQEEVAHRMPSSLPATPSPPGSSHSSRLNILHHWETGVSHSAPQLEPILQATSLVPITSPANSNAIDIAPSSGGFVPSTPFQPLQKASSSSRGFSIDARGKILQVPELSNDNMCFDPNHPSLNSQTSLPSESQGVQGNLRNSRQIAKTKPVEIGTPGKNISTDGHPIESVVKTKAPLLLHPASPAPPTTSTSPPMSPTSLVISNTQDGLQSPVDAEWELLETDVVEWLKQYIITFDSDRDALAALYSQHATFSLRQLVYPSMVTATAATTTVDDINIDADAPVDAPALPKPGEVLTGPLAILAALCALPASFGFHVGVAHPLRVRFDPIVMFDMVVCGASADAGGPMLIVCYIDPMGPSAEVDAGLREDEGSNEERQSAEEDEDEKRWVRVGRRSGKPRGAVAPDDVAVYTRGDALEMALNRGLEGCHIVQRGWGLTVHVLPRARVRRYVQNCHHQLKFAAAPFRIPRRVYERRSDAIQGIYTIQDRTEIET